MTKFARYVHAQRYTTLLISLFVLIIVPFFSDGPFQQLIISVCLSLVFIIAIGAVSTSKRFYLLLAVVTVLLILFEWLLYLVNENHSLRIIVYLIFLSFMVYVSVHLFKFIISSKLVEFQTIMAAFCVYLLIGIIGALLAGIIDVNYPRAFSVSSVEQGLLWNNFLYFSFVTLTTLGYGDIVPIIEESKALAMVLCIVGPFYLATVIAILISKYRENPQRKISD